MDRLDVLAGLVLENDRLWGDIAYDFQWEDARLILKGEGPPYGFLTRPRGASKTTDLAGVVIAMLADLPANSQVDWLAADREQGQLGIDAIRGFVTRTPYLRGVFDVQSTRVVHRELASTLTVLAADAPSAWGRSPRLAVVDELAQWADAPGPRRLWEALSSSLSKRRDSQLAVITTAGAPGHWSFPILEHARSDSLWWVREVAGPVPWVSKERLEEQKRRLTESSYRRLHMNEWVEPEDRLALIEDLDAALVLDGPLPACRGVRYLIGVDIGLKNDRTAIAICHREDETIVCDRIQVWEGSRRRPVDLGEVEAWILEAQRDYNRAAIHIDPYQAVHLIQRLRAKFVRISEHHFSQRSNTEVALTLHNLIRRHKLHLPNDKLLRDELANVRLRETSPGVYRIDHDESRHDDRAIAVGIAAFHLTRKAPKALPEWVPGALDDPGLRKSRGIV